MRRTLLAVALASLVSPFLHADDIPRRYIVVTRWTTRQALPQILRDDLEPRADRELTGWDLINGFAAELTDAEVTRLRQSRHVAYVEPVVDRYLMALPSRPTPNSDTVTPGKETIPYGVAMLNAPAVWPVGRGSAKTGTPIRVAIIDTGIDYDHPELSHSYKGGFDFVNNDNDPLDDEGHGTHVAGIIAAANDSAGVVGVAPDAEIYSLKVLNACGSTPRTTTDVLISAIQWVVNKKQEIGGNWVVNMSLGGASFSGAESSAFQAAADAGVLTFAASGNSYDPASPSSDISYPAAYSSVVAVGAIDSTMKIADFSQRGPALKLVAPGVDVLSTFFGGHVSTNDGRKFIGTLPNASDTNQQPVCLPAPQVSGTFVFCGFGASSADFPSSVKGKIALISRGTSDPTIGVKFTTKVTNAKTAGAIGVILYDNIDEGVFPPSLVDTTASAVVPTVFLSNHDGLDLKNTPSVTVTLGTASTDFLYASLQGTSMSTPHVTAAAALVWSIVPSASRATVLNALITTAHDLGDPGFDQTYGYGLVDPYAASRQLALWLFDPSFSPPPLTPTGRKVTKRAGH